MRRLGSAVLALACWWLAPMRAQEVEPEPRDAGPEAGPELDFLEYLGAWAEEDDEWLAIEEWHRDLGAEAEEGAQQPESEREDDDESE
jgi:hypothetical protein